MTELCAVLRQILAPLQRPADLRSAQFRDLVLARDVTPLILFSLNLLHLLFHFSPELVHLLELVT